jgi:hypothetical protein
VGRHRHVPRRPVLTVDAAALTRLAFEAVRDVSHLFRPGHLAQLRTILQDPEASANDRFVALNMLRNACISAGMVLPSCQDTGTAIVIGKKGQRVWTSADDEQALARGIYDVYQQTNLRYSQLAPLGTFEEKNTGTNLPAQIDLYATDGGRVPPAVRHQGRRLRQQGVALPGDAGAAQREGAPGVPRPEGSGRSARRRARRITSRSSSAVRRRR